MKYNLAKVRLIQYYIVNNISTMNLQNCKRLDELMNCKKKSALQYFNKKLTEKLTFNLIVVKVLYKNILQRPNAMLL